MKSTLRPFLAALLSFAPVPGFAQGFISTKSTGRGSAIIPRIEERLAAAFPNLSGTQASWTASWLSLSKGTFEVIDYGGGVAVLPRVDSETGAIIPNINKPTSIANVSTTKSADIRRSDVPAAVRSLQAALDASLSHGRLDENQWKATAERLDHIYYGKSFRAATIASHGDAEAAPRSIADPRFLAVRADDAVLPARGWSRSPDGKQAAWAGEAGWLYLREGGKTVLLQRIERSLSKRHQIGILHVGRFVLMAMRSSRRDEPAKLRVWDLGAGRTRDVAAPKGYTVIEQTAAALGGKASVKLSSHSGQVKTFLLDLHTGELTETPSGAALSNEQIKDGFVRKYLSSPETRDEYKVLSPEDDISPSRLPKGTDIGWDYHALNRQPESRGSVEVYKVEVLGQALYVLEYPVGEKGALKLYSQGGRYIAKYAAFKGGSVWSVARE